jgi:hypothetical protein
VEERVPRKPRRFMGNAAAYAYAAMDDAIADAGLEKQDVSNVRTGLIVGSGGASASNLVASADTLRERYVGLVDADEIRDGADDLAVRYETHRREDQRRLEAIAGYAKTEGCRSVYIRRWFGEPDPPRCGKCDRCREGKDREQSRKRLRNKTGD